MAEVNVNTESPTGYTPARKKIVRRFSGIDPIAGDGSAGSSTTDTYYQRAFDSGGTEGFVYWSTDDDPDSNPDAEDTTPNFTGTLQSHAVIRIFTT